jgi:hypothetical protein
MLFKEEDVRKYGKIIVDQLAIKTPDQAKSACVYGAIGLGLGALLATAAVLIYKPTEVRVKDDVAWVRSAHSAHAFGETTDNDTPLGQRDFGTALDTDELSARIIERARLSQLE